MDSRSPSRDRQGPLKFTDIGNNDTSQWLYLPALNPKQTQYQKPMPSLNASPRHDVTLAPPYPIKPFRRFLQRRMRGEVLNCPFETGLAGTTTCEVESE